jgi:hypothetical protein
MRLHHFALTILSILTPVLAQSTDDPDDPDPPAPTPTGIDAFANVTPNNTVLAAWNDPSSNGSISIYRSTNSGYSWYPFGTATSDSGKKLLQPHLMYINGTYAEETGTTLLAVNAVDDFTTTIQLYTSGDQGESWDLVSEVANGGPLDNVTAAVQNPYLVHR